MKRLIMIAALTAGLVSVETAVAAEQTVKVAVGNMYCASCPHIVQKSLSAVPGVTRAAVSYKDKSAVVTFDDEKTNVQALIDVVTKAGYPTELTAAAAPRTQ